MSPLLEGLPADIYSNLWILQSYRKLDKFFEYYPIKIVILFTDSPPAVLVNINNNNFNLEILKNVKDSKDLDNIECDAYLVLTTEMLYKGPSGIREAMVQNKSKVKNIKTLTAIAKILGVI